MSAQDVKEVNDDLTSAYELYDGKAWRTMIGYYFCVIGTAVLSAVAALLLQLGGTKEKPWVKDLSSILAALAAILITLNTIVAFNDKWRADRMAASEIESLRRRLKGGDRASKKFYYEQMDAIEKRRQPLVLGQPSSSSPNTNK